LENPLIHIEQDKIKGYDVDLFQRATIPVMVLKMHEAAMQHVLNLGVSAKELVGQNLGWVLVQQYFEFFEQPILGEKISIKTHPTGMHRVFTFRDFKMMNSKSQVVAQASSSWLLMDIQSRKMLMKYPPEILKMLEGTNSFEQLPRPPSLKIKLGKVDFEKDFKVGFHDLDFNSHLSNFFYFRWMLDALPNDFLKNNHLKSLNMRFKEECFMDDELKVRVEKMDEITFHHVIFKGGKILVEGKTIWK